MATFRLFGDDPLLTATAVTDRLGLEPSVARDLVAERDGIPSSSAAWLLNSCAEVEDDVELDDQLRRLLHRLEPVATQLWALVGEGYRASWFCYVGSRAAERAVALDREVLTRILALPGDLLLDVYAG